MSLNDPQWGRGNPQDDEKKKDADSRQDPQNNANDRRDADRQAPQDQDPRRNDKDDLDRLWDEFNRALGGMLGQRPDMGRNRQTQDDRENVDDRAAKDVFAEKEKEFRQRFESMKPTFHAPKANGKGILVATVVALGAWAATGFYIVPEGQSGIVTTFGKYTETTQPGFRWHLPYPIQGVEIVDVSSVRTAEIGMPGRVDREREALMLTDDENIVDVRFTVQYRIKPGEGAMQYLFKSREPNTAVTQAAESAMREVVGRKAMDSVLFESKQEIAEDVKKLMQEMLDRYATGIEVMSVAIQNAQPPQPVQAAFNDAVKAGQDRERQINEGQAYANDVIPKARGMAARLSQEAEGYKARVVETAKGDAVRFKQVLAQYQKAPEVTRDRMYIDTMQQILENTTKVYVDTKSGNNLLYLPFDKLMEQTRGTVTPAAGVPAQTTVTNVPAANMNTEVQDTVDARQLLRNRGR